jgi:hypothetical protein
MSTTADNARHEPVIAPLSERDLPEAERIFRVAFGTFLGVPDPETFWADRDYVYGRWRAPHVTAFGASIDGNLVGSNFATKWGSVGFFGPVTVRPDLQERRQGVARGNRRPVRRLGDDAQWAIHLCTECQTRGPVSEVRVLCAVSDRHNVRTGAAVQDDSKHVAVQHADRSREG